MLNWGFELAHSYPLCWIYRVSCSRSNSADKFTIRAAQVSILQWLLWQARLAVWTNDCVILGLLVWILGLPLGSGEVLKWLMLVLWPDFELLLDQTFQLLILGVLGDSVLLHQLHIPGEGVFVWGIFEWPIVRRIPCWRFWYRSQPLGFILTHKAWFLVRIKQSGCGNRILAFVQIWKFIGAWLQGSEIYLNPFLVFSSGRVLQGNLLGSLLLWLKSIVRQMDGDLWIRCFLRVLSRLRLVQN